MEKLTIKTDHKFRELLHWYELTNKERAELSGLYDGIADSSFFRYRGSVYDLASFMRISEGAPFPENYNGYMSDSFFSGVLIELSTCGEAVKVATYYS